MQRSINRAAADRFDGKLPKAACDRVAAFINDTRTTQRDFAAAVGIPESHLSRALSRTGSGLSFATIQRIAHASGRTVSELLATAAEAPPAIENVAQLRSRWGELLRATEALIERASRDSADRQLVADLLAELAESLPPEQRAHIEARAAQALQRAASAPLSPQTAPTPPRRAARRKSA